MVDLLQIIDNLVAAISPGGGGLTTLFYVMSWIIGLVICIQSLLAAGKRDERGPQGGSIAAVQHVHDWRPVHRNAGSDDVVDADDLWRG